MKIGFFLAYSPDSELGNQGLGRYMALLIKGLLNNGATVTVATPFWSVTSIDDVLKDCEVDIEQIEYLTTRKNPILVQLYYVFQKYALRSKKDKKRYLPSLIDRIVRKAAYHFIGSNNYFTFMLYIAVAVLFLPFVTIGLFIALPVLCARFLVGRLPRLKIRSKVKKLLYKEKRATHVDVRELYEIVYKSEIERLIAMINRSSDVDVWYCPTIFWPEFKKIKGVKVNCIPDLIPMDFPVSFAKEPGIKETFIKSSTTIQESEFCIVYDAYVKQSLLINVYGKADDRVKVIPHGANLMLEYIQIKGGEDSAIDRFSRQLIQNHRNSKMQGDKYLRNFSFEDVRYIFYPSQLRPNKNIMTLIKAFEFMLRRKHAQVKLFLTCDLNLDEQLKDYIDEHRLQYDIISFRNVSAQTLASLYRCADLVVNPTLFEGGFPFTFAEGASVGTPSIMSRIPQTESLAKQYGLDDVMLFDPYDWKELYDKIIWALGNRDTLINIQKPMFESLEERTWTVVAEEYLQAFNHFINLVE